MDCRTGSKLIIDQIKILLEQISDDAYAQSLDIFDGSTVGKHVRHIYDFYYSVIRTEGTGELDYANRDRDPNIETYTASAISKFKALESQIEVLDESKIIDVVTEFDTDNSTLRQRVKSSTGRELMYAYDHAVHHLAIVKMGVRSAFPAIKINAEMGIAPSTLKHQNRTH